MPQLAIPKQRIQSIDLLRGIVIVIMALDHVRDFFHSQAMVDDPTNLATTTPFLFFTRWITHFCAPVFVFLAGTSGFLQGLRKSKKELSLFLLKRGLWLVFAEVALITLALSFDPTYHVFFLQVIWAIGMSMIILSLLVWLPLPVILCYGLGIVLMHNLLDRPEAVMAANKEPLPLWWKFLHGGPFFQLFTPAVPDRGIFAPYAFAPWSGVMALGYCFGTFFRPAVDATARRNRLLITGVVVTLLFLVLRYLNNYGDPRPWEQQSRGIIYTVISFFNPTKYPPSLVYLSMTLGPAIIALALIEKMQNRATRFFVTFGRVPFFFYILHFYLIHILCVIAFFASGYGVKDIVSPQVPFLFRPAQFGFNLAVVYAVWITVILLLYPLCKKYDRFKTKEKRWWTSYL